MKTIYIKSGVRSYALTFALSALIMAGHAQTTHHVGVTDYVFTPSQMEIQAGDTVVWTNTQGHHNVNGLQGTYPDNPESFGNSQGTGWTYTHVFTIPGTYDYQCDPHVNFGMVGQISVSDKASITIDFSNMNPHIGQDLWLNVVDRDTDKEIARVQTVVVVPEFSLNIFGLEPGREYRISFFADHNGNGKYDPPPTDHAWKIDLDYVAGDTTLVFVHNTDFEDIEWENRLKIRYTTMNPHVGQLFQLFLYDVTDEAYVDTITVNPIPGADFDVESEKIIFGHSYNIDFFADHSGNGSYDPPPTDHAWRIHLMDVVGDTTITFVHNTTFTDIFEQPTLLRPAKELKTIQVYPNPAVDFITLSGNDLPTGELTVRILNNNGQIVRSVRLNHSASPLTLQITDLQKGTYFLLIQQGRYQSYSKLVKSE